MLVISALGSAGCSAYLESTRPEYKDPSVIRQGARRSDIVAALGAPVQTYKNGAKDVDVFALDPEGRAPGTKVAVGSFNLVADVLTIGLWEIVATPAELASQHNLTHYIVTYGNDDAVESVQSVSK